MRVNYARTDTVPGGMKSPADLAKAANVAVGALNNTDISGLIAHLSMEVLGVKNKFITGYRGGQEIFLALQRGEIQLHNTSISTFRTRSGSFIKSGEGIGIAYMVSTAKDGSFTPNKHITEMPAFPDLYRQIRGKPPAGGQWEALNWLVQQFSDVAFAAFAPPGVPPAALTELRRAFEAAMNDPELQATGTKQNGIPYEFTAVDKGRAVFKALAEVSPAVLDTVRRTIDAAGGGK